MKMKAIRNLPLPGWRWLLGALAAGVAVALLVPALADTLNVTSYPSTFRARHMTFDSSNVVWAPKYSSPYGVARLDTTTDVLTTWTHSNPAVFQSGTYAPIGVAPTGEVWIGGRYRMNRLDPVTGDVTTWPLATGYTCGDFVDFDSAGNAWFGKSDSRIARLDPSTNTITEWPVPIGTTCPAVVEVDTSGPQDIVWVCESSVRKIGSLDPSTNLITEWTVAASGSLYDCHDRTAADEFWITLATTEILRLNTNTNALTTWTCSLGCSTVYGVAEELATRVWFREYNSGYKLASFDPAVDPPVFDEHTTDHPRGVFVDNAKRIWTAGYVNYTVRRIAQPPTPTPSPTPPTPTPTP